MLFYYLTNIDWQAISAATQILSAIVVIITVRHISKQTKSISEQTKATKTMSDIMAKNETLPKLDFILCNSPDDKPSVTIFNMSTTPGYFTIKTEVNVEKDGKSEPYKTTNSKCNPEDLFRRGDDYTFIGITPNTIRAGGDFPFLLQDLSDKNEIKNALVTLRIHILPVSRDASISIEYSKNYYYDKQWKNRSLGISEDHMYDINSIKLFGTTFH